MADPDVIDAEFIEDEPKTSQKSAPIAEALARGAAAADAVATIASVVAPRGAHGAAGVAAALTHVAAVESETGTLAKTVDELRSAKKRLAQFLSPYISIDRDRPGLRWTEKK